MASPLPKDDWNRIFGGNIGTNPQKGLETKARNRQRKNRNDTANELEAMKTGHT
jgi:hypothetical protein